MKNFICFIIIVTSFMLCACEDEFKKYRDEKGNLMPYNEIMISAAMDGDLDTIKKLHAKGVSLTSRVNENGRTPLHWATATNNLEIMKYLIDNGIDPNIEGGDLREKGYTPMYDTVYGKRIEAAKLLLENGANIDGNSLSGSEVSSPYLLAAADHRIEMCEFFVANGADPKYTKKNGENALIASINNAHTPMELIQFIVKHGADVNAVLFKDSIDEETP